MILIIRDLSQFVIQNPILILNYYEYNFYHLLCSGTRDAEIAKVFDHLTIRSYKISKEFDRIRMRDFSVCSFVKLAHT